MVSIRDRWGFRGGEKKLRRVVHYTKRQRSSTGQGSTGFIG